MILHGDHFFVLSSATFRTDLSIFRKFYVFKPFHAFVRNGESSSKPKEKKRREEKRRIKSHDSIERTLRRDL